MSFVALLCSEPLRPRMAGIGIRYLEMARRLGSEGFDVRLLSPFRDEQDRRGIEEALPGVAVEGTSDLLGSLRRASCVVAQGQLVNDLIHGGLDVPLVADFYDPWLIENLHYHSTMGLDPYRNDHATWLLQMRAADLILCSSEEQRLFYLGLLTAAGRVHPRAVEEDPTLERLIRVVPFGIPEDPGPHRPYLEASDAGRRRILFGGLYDWYDPWPLLEGLRRATNSEQIDAEVIFVHNPSSDTPQQRVREVERWLDREGMRDRVRFIDWVPAERRYDLLRDVDLLASTHRDSIETRLSLRTRFLDALAVRCPVLTTEGGTMSRMLTASDAGWVVPESDADAVATALVQVLGDEEHTRTVVERGLELASRFHWSRALAPLVEYLRAPWRDDSKQDFARALPTLAPADPLSFRVRRKLRQLFGGAS